MSSTEPDEAAQENSLNRPSPPLSREPLPQAIPVIELPTMDPSTPEQEAHDEATPADTQLELRLQPQPVIDVSVTGPTTPERRSGRDVPTQGSTTPNFQTVVNITITTPATHEEQKSPGAAALFGPNNEYSSKATRTILWDQIIKLVCQKVKPILQEKTLRAALVLGSRQHYNMHFDPTIYEIRGELCPPVPGATLRDMVDEVARVMVEGWEDKCRPAISQYDREMKRSLVAEAVHDIDTAKEKIVAAVETQLGRRLLHIFGVARPDTSNPATPTANALVGLLRDFHVSPSPRHLAPSASPTRPTTPRTPRVAPTPRRAPHGGPTNFVCRSPARGRNRRETPCGTPGRPLDRIAGMPTTTPEHSRTPVTYEFSGKMGRHDVFTPITHPRPPPEFKLKREDDK
ncbi:hypothetical protein EKO27_g10192 [Xylaria grammica]|uniref:Uncharacterized protein n=1 Tax=Xylaria grammica TaxID=363999 RepID=A0A439CRZ8_9PEZI|nr:hypothetical protein EKO27_g10192 [Xylaria grammica]